MAYQNQKVKARQVAMANTQTQNLGTVSNVPMGDWNATTQYQKLNTVRSHSATYQAKKNNQGIEPTVTSGWQEVWQVIAYDGGAVEPNGDYPEMTVGSATDSINAQNDGTGTNIAEQFSQVASDIQGLREDITNESHFRGMFQSVAELQNAYPTATPNDYAYIVGGNIYIYQNGAWTDSKEPTPSFSIPPGDTIPLMDGTGSAGTSANYSRNDHRHPSDTTKANTSGTYPGITAGNANQLTTARAIDGVNFNATVNITHYGVCGTSASTTIKDVQITGFTLITGARVAVKFSNTNTSTAPQLRVYSSSTSDGEAKPIYFPNTTTNQKNVLAANRIIEFIYDGTNWVMISGDPLAAYPIGAIYISYTATTPAQLFGGSWTQLSAGTFLEAVGTDGITSRNAGLPNIKGQFGTRVFSTSKNQGIVEQDGAFNYAGVTGSQSFSSGFGTASVTSNAQITTFNANSGAVQKGIYRDEVDTVQPKSQTVYMWRRTA